MPNCFYSHMQFFMGYKTIGLTPSQFKAQGPHLRKALDQL